MTMFDDTWMKSYQKQWNSEPDLKDPLANIHFNSVIGYGFSKEDKCTGYIKIENGECVEAGAYEGQPLNWDLRADEKNWNKWFSKEIGMTGLGLAVTTGKLKFKTGDFKAMISDPRMAKPFVKSFGVMSKS